MPTDIINELAGITADSPLGQLRPRAEVAFNAAQGSFDELFEPADPKGVSRQERDATALRIAILEKSEPVIALHRSRLQGLGLTDADLAAIEQFPDWGIAFAAVDGDFDPHRSADDRTAQRDERPISTSCKRQG